MKTETRIKERITFNEAKKNVASMNLIDGFLFDSTPEHSKKLQEMLKYIISGQKTSAPNADINAIENIIAKVKNRKEVIDEYMRQWDRELSIKREVREEAALNTIRFGHEDGLSDEVIRKRLKTAYKYTDQMINDLFAKIDAEQAMTAK
ncbi:hypothetical protein [Butyrivibrio sp. AE2015]|uniref:hypothetical protein n=1 Tax=Butyrivibrio sp. AE2015 TaxID=1280663 RepID=UPI0003B6BB21|nr:hypothetical protein [Butyrivibrio sp. AE2015]